MRTLEQAPCDALEAAIDSLASEDLTQLDPAEAGCLLQQMVRMRARFDSELSRRVGDFDQREGYRADGSLDTASWLRINCRLSPGAAADHVRVARASRANVELRTALARGDISHHHAAVIARAGQDVGAEAAREISPKLLSLAPHLDPSALRVVAKQEQARVQPESLLQASNREHQRGYLHLSPLDNGMVSINGLADHERASLLDKAAAPYMRPLDAIDDRTVSQRRLDAWVEVARYRLEGGAGASGRSVIGGQRPHLSLIVEERALRQNAAGG
ncbi:MAG TPA: DUF222 domain-containing protein, partial [Candidatus Dormibacteraeota bacterium]|nr:DUF222 domain-containing protein [Candidatus Dormibacteraeota bacterium]